MPENDKGVFWYEDEQRRKSTVHPLLQCDVGTDEKVRCSRKRAERVTGKGQLRDDFTSSLFFSCDLLAYMV